MPRYRSPSCPSLAVTLRRAASDFAARSQYTPLCARRAAGCQWRAAARDMLSRYGFGDDFTHGVGHNVSFAAISTQYPPRLHPASSDLLTSGMTFDIEPAIYIPSYGGMRHCDVVTLGAAGPAILTDFQAKLDDLIIQP